MADREEFETAALPHLDALFRAGLAMTGRAHLAEDLVQETMTKALDRFESFKTGSNCKAWLMRILHNAWIDRMRHQGVVGPTVPVEEQILPQPEEPEPTSWSDPEDMLENFSDQQVIEALSELPPDQRLTLFLVDVEELSQQEVAEVTGVAVGTVKSRTSRARSALKVKLTDYAQEMGFVGRRDAPE